MPNRSGVQLDVYLITIGREILTGRTLDTNAHWLAGRLTRLGARVRQLSCVDDRADEIAAEIGAARRAGSRVVITTGGLGPTHDDVTLKALADAAGRGLRVHPAARRMLERRYRALHRAAKIGEAKITPARLKMARLPVGATPLPNAVGTAPGVHLIWRGLQIFALPGVPAEMKPMFTAEVAPRIARLAASSGRGGWAEVALETPFNDESKLAPLLDEVRADFADVHLKSHPPGFGAGRRIVVTFGAAGASAREARARAMAARRRLAGRMKGL